MMFEHDYDFVVSSFFFEPLDDLVIDFFLFFNLAIRNNYIEVNLLN